MKQLFLAFCLLQLIACTHGHCRNQNENIQPQPVPQALMMKNTDKVKVYKNDGSLQCGQGKAIELSTMAKELGDIQVFSSYSKNDGKMRIQLCGSPTGNCNVFEIPKKDLEKALQLGFKEWIYE